MDAVSADGEAMPTGAPVVVVRLEQNTAVVEPPG
jgi:hypothetical protein